MSNVLLFDIDGTLLNSGGAGQYAMEQALLEVFGVAGPYENILAAGRTDRAITTDLFSHHKIDPSEANWSTFQEAYFRHLPEALGKLDGVVLPGIVDLLDGLAANPNVTLGLLTGNFQTGADLKLRHYQLDHHFAFGGFGDNHFDRDDVARLAMEAACTHLSRTVPGESIWVIGDTPSDIKCGRAIGAKVVAVSTGIYSYEVLEEAGPDFLFTDFSDVVAVTECLTALSK
ncbi:HAD hydrolase-like protein [Thalassoglobus sp. JC818]|uniref:HAD family hydrolase n=1 Tax=Thalassoglobus sp. JC818 TaxID=3232136 RepID=UPI00345A720F